MKILLIGHTGVIGSKLLKYFSGKNQVYTCSRTSGDYKIDLMRLREFNGVFGQTNYDVIISSAVTYPTDESELLVNSIVTNNILCYFKSLSSKFIFISSVSADDSNKDFSVYNYSKFLESKVEDYYSHHLDVCTLRFCQVIDHDGSTRKAQSGFHYMVDCVNNNKDINLFAKNDSARSYISPEIIANAIQYAIDNNITGTHNVILKPELTLAQLAELLCNQNKFTSKINILDKEALHYSIPKSSVKFEEFAKEHDMLSYIKGFCYD